MDWDARYRQRDTPWQRPGLNPAFETWFGGASAARLRGEHVLVPGCGRAPEPAEFARRGASVTGLDIAPTAIAWQTEACAKAGLAGQFLLADIVTWRPDPPAGLIYEQTCLCAIHPRERAAYEAFAFGSLKSGGELYALIMQNSVRPGGPPYHCDVSEMRTLFAPSRWQWQASEPLRSDHPNGMYELGYVLSRLGRTVH